MSILKAPNGKPSKLNPKQWRLVRTPEFKAWFGDWENDPKNASKVVDENGEPLVVYHGSRTIEDFYIFDSTQVGKKKIYGNATFFTDNYEVAKSWTRIENEKIFEVFLNIRKPKVFDFMGANWEGYNDELMTAEYGDEKYLKNKDGSIYFQQNEQGEDEIIRLAKKKGLTEDDLFISYGVNVTGYDINTLVSIYNSPYMRKDGVIAYRIVDLWYNWRGKNPVGNSYIVFKPTQIKLADGSNTKFDGKNPDIRFAKGGKVEILLAPNGKPSNLNPEQYKLVRTPAFKKWFGDWENDPANASKVVDENGEPLVVYRGFNSKSDAGNVFRFGINRFKENRNANRFGHYFTRSINVAKEYAEQGEKKDEKDVIVKSYFLKADNLADLTKRNPRYPTFNEWALSRESFTEYSPYALIERLKERTIPTHSYLFTSVLPKAKNEDDIDELSKLKIKELEKKIEEDKKELKGIYDSSEVINLFHLIKMISGKELDEVIKEDYDLRDAQGKQDVYKWFINYKKSDILVIEGLDLLLKDLFIENNFNGGVFNEWQFGVKKPIDKEVFFVFEPNQIKLADGSNTAFDSSNPDIRYDDGGEVESITFYTRTYADGTTHRFSVEDYEKNVLPTLPKDGKFDLGGEIEILLAPNGKPSNLTPEQYKLVRTPAFKKWFGDWENDPENASKVVDENGEPLVMWHKSTSIEPYFEFDKKLINENDPDFWSNGFWFSRDMGNTAAWTQLGGDGFIRSFFLNIRNILKNDEIEEYENTYYDEIEENSGTKNRLNLIERGYNGVEFEKIINPAPIMNQIFNRNEKIIIDRNTHLILGKSGVDLVYDIIENGQNIDAIYLDTWDGKKLEKQTLEYQLSKIEDLINQGVVIAFEPNQIKLADGTNTTFDGNNPDIRYELGGETPNIHYSPILKNTEIVKDLKLTKNLLSLSHQGLSGGIKAVWDYPYENVSNVVIAYINSKPIGVITDTNGVQNIFVKSEYRGFGIGKSLKNILNNKDMYKKGGKTKSDVRSEKPALLSNGLGVLAYEVDTKKVLLFKRQNSDTYDERDRGKWGVASRGIMSKNQLSTQVAQSLLLEKAGIFSDYIVPAYVYEYDRGFQITKFHNWVAFLPDEKKIDLSNSRYADAIWISLDELSYIIGSKGEGDKDTYTIDYKDIQWGVIELFENSDIVGLIEEYAKKYKESRVIIEEEVDPLLEKERIKLKYKELDFDLDPDETKKVLLAPNGKVSNLDEKQWKAVRSANFKKWFGDWEEAYRTGDYANVSKVIDENGEPLVVYRGHSVVEQDLFGYVFSYNVNRFKFNRQPNRFAFYFTKSKKIAELYSQLSPSGERYGGVGIVKPYFLNVRGLCDLTPNNPYYPTTEWWFEHIMVGKNLMVDLRFILQTKGEYDDYFYLTAYEIDTVLNKYGDDSVDISRVPNILKERYRKDKNKNKVTWSGLKEYLKEILPKAKKRIDTIIKGYENSRYGHYINLNILLKCIFKTDNLSKLVDKGMLLDADMEKYLSRYTFAYFINQKSSPDGTDIVLKKMMIKKGYTGGVFLEHTYAEYLEKPNEDVYFVFDSNNIKLADGSNYTYKPDVMDTRYEDGGMFQIYPD